MIRRAALLIAGAALLGGGPARAAAVATPAGMRLIPAGTYAPLFRTVGETDEVAVEAFYLDVRPVTNGEFLAFVEANPRWRRSRVSRLFADPSYLGNWAGDLDPGAGAPADSPVVQVSWFAARAYADWMGKRLPTTSEWERAAAVGFDSADGANDPELREGALAWFSVPTPPTLPAAGAGRPNFFGIRDLHTLVWEWVEDFNTSLVTGESRADSALERNLFCAAGAVGAPDTTDYPAFMRAGFRSSLRASYTVPNLGFRCASSP